MGGIYESNKNFNFISNFCIFYKCRFFRYKNAVKCFSESQNAATEMREVGLSAPQFTCLPVAKGKDFKIYRKNDQSSRFPF